MNRKVCIITGTRAEYGLLRWVMQGIKADPELTLQIIATGMHLSPEFGLTYREIEQDGFQIDRKVEMLTSSDTPVGIAKSMGLGLIGFADALNDLHPDLIVVLGDRFEIFSAVSAALVARIPVAHLHGGEATEGSIDEALRHSITKMSHIHFVATEKSRKRVIQLGEDPNSVFLVGGLGVDAIKNIELLKREELENKLGIKFLNKNLLVTFHPETLGSQAPEKQFEELLYALDFFEDTSLIFTMPNADTGGKKITKMIEEFVETHSNAYFYKSLGQQKYLSVIAQVDGVIGNSSSGLLEVPTFKKGTINIGNRQLGREQSLSVINCKPLMESIKLALEQLYSIDFGLIVSESINPYGEGGASLRILSIIQELSLVEITKKTFYDL